MSRVHILLLPAVSLLLLIGAESRAVPAEQSELKAVMRSWIDAVVNEDNETLPNVLSRDSFSYYRRLQELALYGEHDRLDALDFPDQI